jgi:S1-C subfamily serine protease
LFSEKLFDKASAESFPGGFTVKFSATLTMSFLALSPAALPAQVQTTPPPSFSWREAQPGAEDSELERLNRAFVQLARHSRPAIVQIRTSGHEAPSSSAPIIGSRGSGFIIDPKGYLLTAHHVIDKAKEIGIRLADAQRFPARVIAADAQVDLAILKIQTERELRFSR